MLRRIANAALVAGAISVLELLSSESLHALPAGRSWAPTATWEYPGVTAHSSTRIEADSSGIPYLVVRAHWHGDELGTLNLFAWKDSLWDHIADTGGVGGLHYPETALSLTSSQYMTWVTGSSDRDGFHRMAFAQVRADGIDAPDTVMVTIAQDSEFDAAVSARRRWVARSWQKPPYDGSVFPRLTISVAYSDTPKVWRFLPDIGVDEFMCAIAPLSDTTAMLVYAGESGLAYRIADGNRWGDGGVLDPRPLFALHPRLAFRRSGGLWLLWTDRYWVHVSHYRDGQWSRGDSLQGVHKEGETYWSAWSDPSLDGAERPVLVWGDLGYGYTYRDVGMVAFPTDSGWTSGEEIPGSENLFLTPLVARDRNGDVWVNWRVRDFVSNRWTHTYVHATCSAPTVLAGGQRRSLTWRLSEAAPESWWAVLRSRNGAPFEEVARVQARQALGMGWADESQSAGVLRYKIRRESVDSRYRWESQEAIWPPKARHPLVLTLAGGLVLSGKLELAGADAGPIELKVYDVQGRLVLLHQDEASGSGRDSLELDLQNEGRGIGAGVYFVVAQDSSGREALPLKVVILR